MADAVIYDNKKVDRIPSFIDKENYIFDSSSLAQIRDEDDTKPIEFQIMKEKAFSGLDAASAGFMLSAREGFTSAVYDFFRKEYYSREGALDKVNPQEAKKVYGVNIDEPVARAYLEDVTKGRVKKEKLIEVLKLSQAEGGGVPVFSSLAGVLLDPVLLGTAFIGGATIPIRTGRLLGRIGTYNKLGKAPNVAKWGVALGDAGLGVGLDYTYEDSLVRKGIKETFDVGSVAGIGVATLALSRLFTGPLLDKGLSIEKKLRKNKIPVPDLSRIDEIAKTLKTTIDTKVPAFKPSRLLKDAGDKLSDIFESKAPIINSEVSRINLGAGALGTFLLAGTLTSSEQRDFYDHPQAFSLEESIGTLHQFKQALSEIDLNDLPINKELIEDVMKSFDGFKNKFRLKNYSNIFEKLSNLTGFSFTLDNSKKSFSLKKPLAFHNFSDLLYGYSKDLGDTLYKNIYEIKTSDQFLKFSAFLGEAFNKSHLIFTNEGLKDYLSDFAFVKNLMADKIGWAILNSQRIQNVFLNQWDIGLESSRAMIEKFFPYLEESLKKMDTYILDNIKNYRDFIYKDGRVFPKLYDELPPDTFSHFFEAPLKNYVSFRSDRWDEELSFKREENFGLFNLKQDFKHLDASKRLNIFNRESAKLDDAGMLKLLEDIQEGKWDKKEDSSGSSS